MREFSEKAKKDFLEQCKAVSEEWREIDDFPMYAISNYGEVKNIKTDKLLTPQLTAGYYRVFMCNSKGTYKTKSVSRLVAEAFIPNPENKEEVDHIDRCRDNNVVWNLRWATRSENLKNRGDFNKAVCQFDKKGNYIRTFDNISEAVESLDLRYNSGNVGISQCCRKKRPTAFGYIWKYKGDCE